MTFPSLFKLSELMLQQEPIVDNCAADDDGASENEIPSPPPDPDGARYQLDQLNSKQEASFAAARDPSGSSAVGEIDANLLLQVDLLSVESINKHFFPHVYAKGRSHWIIVPPHIIGIDTDFSLVVKKVQQFGLAPVEEQQKEHTRWSAMQAWERHMYEDRIAILMQQQSLQQRASAGAATADVPRRRKRGSLASLDNTSTNSTSLAQLNTPLRQFMAQKPPAAMPSIDQLLTGADASSSSWPLLMQAAKQLQLPDDVDNSRTNGKKGRVVTSKCKCVRMKPPIPTKFRGSKQFLTVEVPDFAKLMNFPAVVQPDGTRSCVMCGTFCPTSSNGTRAKKTVATGRKPTNGALQVDSPLSTKSSSSSAIIPTQNKGLCTMCDVMVWIVSETQMEIKWCKGCKNFRPWAAFGDKGHATKCVRCRDRQREKYAAQKMAISLKRVAQNFSP